jgi:hypothetical protein
MEKLTTSLEIGQPVILQQLCREVAEQERSWEVLTGRNQHGEVAEGGT